MGSSPDPLSPAHPCITLKHPQNRRVILHVELRLIPDSDVRPDSITQFVRHWLIDNFTSLQIGQDLSEYIAKSKSPSKILSRSVEAINVVEAVGSSEELISLDNVELRLHAYRIYPSASVNLTADEFTDAEEQPPARILELPAKELDGVWDHLYYYPDVKTKLLHFITTIVFFTEKRVNFKCISFNRLILLHGPPGSGKTSLCRALAHKISIRLASQFSHSRLIEINAHALCSKWFSESGKLVAKLFDNILTMLEDEDLFVTVLIDEVESLVSNREAMVGNEPIDSLRVVNSLLTALDKLRHKTNVIVLTTSNLPKTMDAAFLDRVDIKQYVGCPGPETCYSILRSCLNELIRCQIIDSITIPLWSDASMMLYSKPDAPSSKLWHISKECATRELSGRALKKLPILMHAEWIQQDTCSMNQALDALWNCIVKQETLI